MREGDIVQLKVEINDKIKKGYIYLIESFKGNYIHLIRLLPNWKASEKFEAPIEFIDLQYFKKIDINVDNVIKGCYELVEIPGDYKLILSNSLNKPKINDKLTFEILSKLFKYIPTCYNGYNGFYYNGEIINKVNYEVKNNNRKLGYNRPKKVITRSRMEFYPINEIHVPKFFSINTLLTQCQFRIKDYKKSSKLFAYTEAKKLLLNKIVKVEKIELQSQVKKSDQLEDTIYVKVENKNLRFSLDDVEILYPNIKGLHKSKDRKILKGSSIKIVKNKDLRYIPIGTNLKVDKILNVNKKRYIGFIYNNKQVLSKINNFKLV